MARKPKNTPLAVPASTVAAVLSSGAGAPPAPERRSRAPRKSASTPAIGKEDAALTWMRQGGGADDAGRSLEEDEASSANGQPAYSEATSPTNAVDQFREEAPPSPPAETDDAAATPANAAVTWDRATDSVTFDWPEIERTASQVGPNQAMAKLLVAARAEGTRSRWPFAAA